MTLDSRLQNAVDDAALAPAMILSDADTVYLGRGWGWNDYQAMAVDRSVVAVDMDTATPTYMERAGAGVPDSDSWTIEVVFRLATPTDATADRGLLGPFDAVNDIPFVNWRFGNFRFWYDGAYRVGLALVPPGLAAAPSDFYLTWTLEPNPATTGPADAVLSTTRMWNLATGAYVEGSEAHPLVSLAPGFVFGAGLFGGTVPFTGDVGSQAATRTLRISKRARGRAELENIRPRQASWPAPAPFPSLLTDLSFFPNMDTLLDPISGELGVADGTTYDAVLDARVFDGLTDRIDWPSISDLGGGQPFSYACLLQLDSLPHTERILQVAQAGAGTQGVIVQVYATGDVRFQVIYTGTNLTVDTAVGALTVGPESLLTVTYDGSGLAAGVAIYIDGLVRAPVFGTDGTLAQAAAAGLWSLGGSTLGDTLNFDGTMRDARGWNRVLTAAEVYNLWQSAPHRL